MRAVEAGITILAVRVRFGERRTVHRLGISENGGSGGRGGFHVHPHMLRHSCGFALANKGTRHASTTGVVRASQHPPAFARQQKKLATPVIAVTSALAPATKGEFVAGPLATKEMSSELVTTPPVTEEGPVAGQNPYVAAVAGVANEKQGYPQTDQNAATTETAEAAAFEERAAVIEYDGDVHRSWAEALARLDPSHPPADVPPKRWLLFLNDCGQFVDSAWINRAIELGWTPLDLFGCHETKPYARLSHCGLLWFVKGRRILSMDTDRAIIETDNGSLVYWRCHTQPGQICVWELEEKNHIPGAP